MATVSVGNTSANISGDTLLTAQNDQTVTGQTTFDRDPSAPFVVTASSAVVTNLDADKVDGYEASALAVLAENETVTGNWTHSGTVVFSAAATFNALMTFGATSIVGTSYVPTWGNSGTANTLGNGTIAGQYTQLGKLVFFRTILTWGSTTASGNGQWTFTLPVTADSYALGASIQGLGFDASAVASYVLTGANTSTTVFNVNNNATPLAGVSSTAPFTWATSDAASFLGFYWAA